MCDLFLYSAEAEILKQGLNKHDIRYFKILTFQNTANKMLWIERALVAIALEKKWNFLNFIKCNGKNYCLLDQIKLNSKRLMLPSLTPLITKYSDSDVASLLHITLVLELRKVLLWHGTRIEEVLSVVVRVSVKENSQT